MDAGCDASRTITISSRSGDCWAELVLLCTDADGALTLEVRNQGYPVRLQIGEDVDEYRRRWTVAATDVARLVDTWLEESGDRHRSEAQPADQGELPLAIGRRIIGHLAANDEGSTIAGRFITWLIEHAIPYRSEEDPSTDDRLKHLLT